MKLLADDLLLGETDMIAGRLEVSGWFGAVASTHWLATQAAMGVLERGGNAFDGAVVAGLVMQVAQPHHNGPAGDVAIMLHEADTRRISSVCGQGPAPAAATMDHFSALGLDMIPGTGMLSAVVPGAFDAWMHLLAEHGTIELAEALGPAITYAENGVLVDQRLHDTLRAAAPMFCRYWPTSAAMYLDEDGKPPPVGALLANPTLGAIWRRLIDETAQSAPDRAGRIAAAREIWSDGFIADAIDTFCAKTRVMDVSGRVHGAVLTGEDMAGWRANVEPTLSTGFNGHLVHKCGIWTQGPTLLQALNLLDVERVRALDPQSAEFVHLLAESTKLAMADRDAHYGLSGDAKSMEARLQHLLSESYVQERRDLIGKHASVAFRPGGDPAWMPNYDACMQRHRDVGLLAAYGGGEPTIVYEETEMAGQSGLTGQEQGTYVAHAVGDTSYLSIADAAGNVVSATPSGGWLQSSPLIPELGFALGTRAQTMWLDENSPSALVPGTRPRTTLTPTLVTNGNGDVLALGTPGGDQQDQWQLAFLARHLVQGQSLQTALDAPGFHTNHLVNSFYPRGAQPGTLVLEDRFDANEIEALRALGHSVSVVGSWIEGRLCAVASRADGSRHAGVSTRGGQALAVAR